MAISLKGMRKISVDGEVFLWKIRHKISHDEAHNVQYAIPVQHSSGGQVVFVLLGFTRAYGYGDTAPKQVTPAMIKPLIEQAISLGWAYNQPGQPRALVNGALHADTSLAKQLAP